MKKFRKVQEEIIQEMSLREFLDKLGIDDDYATIAFIPKSIIGSWGKTESINLNPNIVGIRTRSHRITKEPIVDETPV